MKVTLLIILLVLSGLAFGQYNLSTTYCGHNDLNSARYEPSELDLGEKRFQFGMNVYGWLGNSAMTYNLVSELYQGKINSIRNMVDAHKSQNILGIGFDVQLAGIAFQFKNKKDKRIDISLTAVDKAGFTVVYSDDVARLIAYGNGQFRGKTVDLGSTRANGLYYREYALGTAFPLFGNQGKDEGIGMRLGFRLKYLQGIASAKMTMRRATIFVPQDGSYIETNLDYKMETSAVSDYENFSPFASNGMGFGVDLGATLHIGNKIEINGSIMDIGSITFTEKVRTFSKNGVYRYEGQTVGYFFGDFKLTADSLYFFTPDQNSGGSYTQNLGSRLLLQAEFKTPKIGKKDREYTSNAVFVTYVQGFYNVPGATSRPFLSVAYNHDFHKAFDLGIMAGYGGYNQLVGGAFMSINLFNTVKWGFGSDNIIPLMLKTRGTGIDFQTNLSISF